MNTVQANKQGYSNLSKWLHWGMALMIVVLLSVGIYMTGLDKADPSRLQLTGVHKSFGAVFILLAVFRLLWSRIQRSPPLPKILASWEQILAHVVTATLYLLMLAIPLSGIAMTNFAGFPVSIFGLIELPQLFGKNLAMAGLAKQTHVILGYLLMAAILLHIAGALKHRYLDAPEADVLPRMLPIKPRN